MFVLPLLRVPTLRLESQTEEWVWVGRRTTWQLHAQDRVDAATPNAAMQRQPEGGAPHTPRYSLDSLPDAGRSTRSAQRIMARRAGY